MTRAWFTILLTLISLPRWTVAAANNSYQCTILTSTLWLRVFEMGSLCYPKRRKKHSESSTGTTSTLPRGANEPYTSFKHSCSALTTLLQRTLKNVILMLQPPTAISAILRWGLSLFMVVLSSRSVWLYINFWDSEVGVRRTPPSKSPRNDIQRFFLVL